MIDKSDRSDINIMHLMKIIPFTILKVRVIYYFLQLLDYRYIVKIINN